ncbi:MAG: Gfo/Idh/MocA family oxidoreductase [Candidatus Eremiobacteraeota bacterium]|nr:Gfo/Idh/MocA family oxidoreductase [Candidatus Eremiobacteraeota bacterium]
MAIYRIGIVGAGFGVSSHLPALLAHPAFDVVALASPSTAARIAVERNIPHAFRSCAQMLAGCELDAVTIASPPYAHLHDVRASLAARKHVICEKPFALNVESALTMVEAAHEAGTACGVAHEFRFVAQARALKQLIENHHLDPVRNIEITSLRRMLHRHETRRRGWWFARERGGGLAGAMLSHLIDHADWLAGTAPQGSSGLLRTANVARRDDAGDFTSNVDDGAFALLAYANGEVARLTADATTSVDGYTCAVHGEDRTAVASGPTIAQLTLYTIDRDETNELECKPSPYASYASINDNVPLLIELYDEFVRAIEGKANLLPTFDEALATQRVLESIGYTTATLPAHA